jgi:hypothetical protein
MIEAYVKAAHATQAAVKVEYYNSDLPAKGRAAHYLDNRIGLSIQMVEFSAVALLLIEKGIFTMDEMKAAFVTAHKQEQDRIAKAVMGDRPGPEIEFV